MVSLTDLPSEGQPIFSCMLSTKHLQSFFMDISDEKGLDFFFASPFSLLCSIFCPSKPKCPKKKVLPPCSEFLTHKLSLS